MREIMYEKFAVLLFGVMTLAVSASGSLLLARALINQGWEAM
jgi:hypothetical protein